MAVIRSTVLLQSIDWKQWPSERGTIPSQKINNSIDLNGVLTAEVKAPCSHQIRTDGALTSKSILHVIKGKLLDQILHVDGKSSRHGNVFVRSITTTAHKRTDTSRRGQNQRHSRDEKEALDLIGEDGACRAEFWARRLASSVSSWFSSCVDLQPGAMAVIRKAGTTTKLLLLRESLDFQTSSSGWKGSRANTVGHLAGYVCGGSQSTRFS